MKFLFFVLVVVLFYSQQACQFDVKNSSNFQQSSSSSSSNSITYSYSYILSKILSILIILGSAITRIPQIITISSKKSVEGLSYFGNNLQFIMTSLTFAFGIYAQLPVSVYIENFLLMLQNGVILIFFLCYSQLKLWYMIKILIPSLIISIIFMLQLVPPQLQQLSMWTTLIVFILGRGSQLIQNYRNQSTGNLSLTTMLIILIGNLTRIYTTLMQASQQIVFLLNFIIPFFINGIIILQFYLYKKIKKQ